LREDQLNQKEFHKLLADQGIRIFSLSLGSDQLFMIHPNKTVNEWRSDIRSFISEINNCRNKEGHADDDVFNTLMVKFNDAGYFQIEDTVSDVYEGRIAKYTAGIEDDPAHEEQVGGFGHYGWESKKEI
jgi:hypothetical protein